MLWIHLAEALLMMRGLLPLYIYIENFKSLLVRKNWTDFFIIWQESFFGDSLPKWYKPSFIFCINVDIDKMFLLHKNTGLEFNTYSYFPL